MAALVTFGVAVAFAVLFPEDSAIGDVAADSNLLEAASRHAVTFVGAGFLLDGELLFRTAPAVLVLIPIVACALGAAAGSNSTRGMTSRARLFWGLATGVPFGLLMLIPALNVGEFAPGAFLDEGEGFTPEVTASVGGALGLGVLWGMIGGGIGVIVMMRRDSSDLVDELFPWRGAQGARTVVSAALKPFGLAVLICALIGTGVWLTQTVRDEGDTRELSDGRDRGLGLALVENGLYAGDYAVNTMNLGAWAEFRRLRALFAEDNEVGRPLPIGSASAFYSDEGETEVAEDIGLDSTITDETEATEAAFDSFLDDPNGFLYSGGYRLSEYSEATEPYFFVPMLIVLTLIPGGLALYAGFAVARRITARSMVRGAAWGALVGPIWATAAVILNAIILKDVIAKADGDSVFVVFLLGGAAFGALGGLLATQRTARSSPPPPPPPPSRAR